MPLRAPLCPAGHLPHKGGDQLSSAPSPTTGVAERAAGETAGRSPPLWGRCPAGQRGARRGGSILHVAYFWIAAPPPLLRFLALSFAKMLKSLSPPHGGEIGRTAFSLTQNHAVASPSPSRASPEPPLPHFVGVRNPFRRTWRQARGHGSSPPPAGERCRAKRGGEGECIQRQLRPRSPVTLRRFRHGSQGQALG